MKSAAFRLTSVVVLSGAVGAAACAPRDPGARYVRLALALDAATDGGYVFAYRGPTEDRQDAVAAGLSIGEIANEAKSLIVDIDATGPSGI